MQRPKQIRNVDAEVTHWSDDISGEVVLEIVTALRKRLRRVSTAATTLLIRLQPRRPHGVH